MRRCKHCKKEVFNFTIGEWKTAVCNCSVVVANTKTLRILRLDVGKKYDDYRADILEEVLQVKRRLNEHRMKMDKQKKKFPMSNKRNIDERLVYSLVS